MAKKKIWLIAAISIIVVLAASLCVLYANAGECKTFPQNTYINGIDCSNLTVNQAERILTKEYNHKEYVIITDQKKQTLSDFGLKYDIKGQLEFELRLANIRRNTGIFGSDINVEVTMRAFDTSEKMLANLKLLHFQGTNLKKTQNAYIDMDDSSYPIIPEVYGNNLDFPKMAARILSDIESEEWQGTFVLKDYYELPVITKDDEDLLSKQEYCRTYLSQEIVYDLGNEQYKISGKDLDKMLKVDDQGNVSVKKKQVKKFVKKLAKKCDTIGRTRAFKSTLQGTKHIGGGTFGRLVDVAKESKKLAKNLLKGKNITRKPVYSINCVSPDGLNVGSTYVEVDLSNQHFWYYENGKVAVEADVVSGDLSSGHSTSTGVFYVVYKQRDVKLKGRNDDGTKYESPVSYWMPFYYDIGLHDANWRGEFGGSIYKNGGSHGCVNLPVREAGALYERVYPGCPVVVFY